MKHLTMVPMVPMVPRGFNCDMFGGHLVTSHDEGIFHHYIFISAATLLPPDDG